MSSKSDQNITGYKYSLSILMGLCRGPVEQIVQIKVGDMVAWTGPLIRGAVQIPIYQPQLFGGDEAEGGVVGGFDFYDGNSGQNLPDTTIQIISSTNEIAVATTDGSSLIPLPPVDKDADSSSNDEAPTTGNPTIPIVYQLTPVPVPGLRGVATLWFDGQICSNNPYPKEWKVRLRRVLEGWDGDPWYPEAAVIPLQDQQALATAATDTANVQASASQDEQGNGDSTVNTTPASTAILLPESGAIYAMNPAHILYEVITNRVWGRGLDRTLIDDASFTSAANWLLQEGFGLCLKWSKADDMATFIQHTLDTMGGILFTSRLTGLLTLKLIRNDYNVSQLPTMDYNSGLISVEDATNNSQDALVNEVVVKYHSPVSNTDRQVRTQNLASITTLDSVYSATKEYPGIPTPDLAQRVAQRDLAAIAWGVKTYELSCDRRAYKIQPGDCFVLTAPDRNILNTVLRLIKMEDGTMTNGILKLTCSQDVFGLPLTTFGQPEPTRYNPPNRDPQPVTYHRLQEMTYRDAYLKLSSSDLAALGPGQTGFMDLPAQPTTLSIGFRLRVSTGGPAVDAGIKAFARFVRLTTKIGKYDTTLTLVGFPAGFSFSLPACLLVDDEFMRVDTLDVYTGIATVARGVVDSLPQRHAAGAVAWFYDTALTDSIEYAVGETITTYEQTRTSKGFLPLDQAIGQSLVLVGRQERPYPPANVTINGPYAQDSDTGQWTITAADLTIYFARRNRITLGDQMVGFSEPDMVPEAGQTTTVRIRRMSDNAIVGTYPGITGTAFTYTQVQAVADGAFGLIQVELYSQIGTTTSRYVYAYPLNYYPAQAVAPPPAGKTQSIGISQSTLFLTDPAGVLLGGHVTVTAAMAATFAFVNAGQQGSIPHVGQGAGNLALTGHNEGSTLGGFSLNATILLTSALAGSAPALGQSAAVLVTLASQGDPAHNASLGRFVLTAGGRAMTSPVAGSYGAFALTGGGTGTIAGSGVNTGNLALTSQDTGTVAATGSSSGNFAFTSVDQGNDIATGTSGAGMKLTAAQTASAASTAGSFGNFALTSVEAAQATATGQQSANLALTSAAEAGTVSDSGTSNATIKLTAIQASSQIATMQQNATLAFTNGPDTGTVQATGQSTGNLALTSVEASQATATGTSTGAFKLTAGEAGQDIATGTSTGNMALTAGESGSVPNTIASTGNFALTSQDAGTVAATGTSTGNAALTSAESGTVAATGTSTGNFAFTNGGEAATVQATGTSTGALKMTAVEAGSSGGGYGNAYGARYGS